MFLLDSVTFSKFFRIYYLYVCLVTTVLFINTLFISPLWYTYYNISPVLFLFQSPGWHIITCVDLFDWVIIFPRLCRSMWVYICILQRWAFCFLMYYKVSGFSPLAGALGSLTLSEFLPYLFVYALLSHLFKKFKLTYNNLFVIWSIISILQQIPVQFALVLIHYLLC